jgi:large subunit ribosomal protein L35
MPKCKTKRGAAKRFKVTGSGRIKRARAYHRHQLSAKTRKQKRTLGHSTLVASVDERAIKRILPGT